MKRYIMIALIAALRLAGCSKADDVVQSFTDTRESYAAEESSATQESSEASDTGATYRLSVPEGYTELDVEGIEFYYMYEDGSNINMNIQAKDAGFGLLTADTLNAALASTFKQTYDVDIAITDHYFTTEKISGYSAYQYCISYVFQDISFTQLIVGIDADRTYTFTYTDVADGTWLSTFEESAKSIVITP